jgi:hypothetical protein
LVLQSEFLFVFEVRQLRHSLLRKSIFSDILGSRSSETTLWVSTSAGLKTCDCARLFIGVGFMVAWEAHVIFFVQTRRPVAGIGLYSRICLYL